MSTPVPPPPPPARVVEGVTLDRDYKIPLTFGEFDAVDDKHYYYIHLRTLIQEGDRWKAERDASRSLYNQTRQELATAREQLTASNNHTDALEAQVRALEFQLTAARAPPPLPPPPPPLIVPPPPVNNPPPVFRLEKFPDPPKFNGTRKELPVFLNLLRTKLRVNHDRFLNEEAKVFYAVSRLEGKALDQVIPMATGETAPFASVAAFVAFLEASFGDPDPRGTARRELQSLRQGKGDFATYLTQFLRVMGQLDYNEEVKKDALETGLSDDLKDAMIYQDTIEEGFDAYVRRLMTMDNRIRARKDAHKTTRNPMGQFAAQPAAPDPSHTPGGLAPMDLSALQAHPTIRPPPEGRYAFFNCRRHTTAAEKKWRMENGRCAYCAAPDHVFANCPQGNCPHSSPPAMRGAALSAPPAAPISRRTTDFAEEEDIGE